MGLGRPCAARARSSSSFARPVCRSRSPEPCATTPAGIGARRDWLAAGAVTSVFNDHHMINESVTDFYAYLASELTRYDLAGEVRGFVRSEEGDNRRDLADHVLGVDERAPERALPVAVPQLLAGHHPPDGAAHHPQRDHRDVDQCRGTGVRQRVEGGGFGHPDVGRAGEFEA